MTAYSLLDLVPVTEGSDVATALAEAANLARDAESLGYTRYWVAEHHGMPGIASAATAVVIGHVAAATTTIRVGAGGIMLPNHSPLQVAEAFGTLDALFPGRIDLGLGRAPGSDQRVALALRRTLASGPDAFPRDVLELQSYFADDGQTGISATPGAGARVPITILGSSLFGAQLAAALGLPYAFASHFAPDLLDQAVAVYREGFRPSAACPRPYLMIGQTIIVGESDEEAALLASSMQQSVIALRTGTPGRMTAPIAGYHDSLDQFGRAAVDHFFRLAAVGSVATARSRIAELIARTGADEVILTAPIFDPAARRRSIALTAGIMHELATPVAA